MPIDVSTITTATILWTAAVMSPGPASAAIMHRAMTSSQTDALRFMFGVIFGSAIYGAITLFALGAFLDYASYLARYTRWVGGALLVWMGLSAWTTRSADSRSHFSIGGFHFRDGLLLELTNPKGIVFFVSVFAAAVPKDSSPYTKIAIISLALAFEIIWYVGVVTLFSHRTFRGALLRSQTTINRIFGTLFIGFGLYLGLWEI